MSRATSQAIPTGATQANAFAAIQYLVFDLKKYTIEELVKALDANWAGYEVMRQHFLNAPDVTGAEWVDVAPGQIVTGIDFVLQPAGPGPGPLVPGRR